MRTIRNIAYTTITILLFFAVLFMGTAAAQGQGSTVAPRWSFGLDTGGACLPGMLFSLDKSIKQHPDRLCGYATSPFAGYRLSRTITLRLSFFNENVDGNGPWMRDTGDPAQAGVSGVAIGHTSIRIYGPVFTVQKSFRPTARFRPFIEGGGGIGLMKVNFRGSFSGVDGDGDPFVDPGIQDRISPIIPLVQAGAGALIPIGNQRALTFGYRWNTGNIVYGGITVNPAPIIGAVIPGHGKKK